MTAADLANIFGPILLSKKYLFQCKVGKKNIKDKKYEINFIKMVKILIFYAPEIFPDLERVNWKVSTLVCSQGQEKEMIKHYNDQFSKETKKKKERKTKRMNTIQKKKKR
eukprot:377493_1